MYQFSDFPWPSSVTEEFPSQNQVLGFMFNLMLAILTCLSRLSSISKLLELNLKAILMKRCGHLSYEMAMACPLALKGNERL